MMLLFNAGLVFLIIYMVSIERTSQDYSNDESPSRAKHLAYLDDAYLSMQYSLHYNSHTMHISHSCLHCASLHHVYYDPIEFAQHHIPL